MRLLEDRGGSSRWSSADLARGEAGLDDEYSFPSLTADDDDSLLSFTADCEHEDGLRQRPPILFALKMTVAILLACSAITLFPGGRPDRIVVSSDVYVRAGITPSSLPAPTSTTTSTTTFVIPPAPFLVDYAAINQTVAPMLDVVDNAPAPSRAEPEIPPESEWVDSGNGVAVPDVLLRVRFCESTNGYDAAHVRSTASGAYQFLTGSWDWYGHAARYGVGSAAQAQPAQQDEAAVLTMRQSGLRPWAASRSCWADPGINPRYATIRPPAPAPTTTVAPAPAPTDPSPSAPPSSEDTTSSSVEPSTTAPSTTATSVVDTTVSTDSTAPSG